jgi:hypothetical protein
MIAAERYRFIAAPTLMVWMSYDPTAVPEEGQADR